MIYVRGVGRVCAAVWLWACRVKAEAGDHSPRVRFMASPELLTF